ncbi:hypothetical protein [Azospirillum argentinense]
MHLDGNTLFAMTGGMIFLSALVATLLYKLNTSVPGPRGWAWGNILVGVFFLLRMLPAPAPEWLSIAAADPVGVSGQPDGRLSESAGGRPPWPQPRHGHRRPAARSDRFGRGGRA